MNRLHWTRWGLLLSAVIFVSTALAQSPVPRRTEPGTPPEAGGGGSAWSTVNITGQIPGSTLGSLAVDPNGNLFVWSVGKEFHPFVSSSAQVDPRRTDPGPDMPPGGGGPNLGVYVTVSTLYNWNGISWTPSLRLFGETGTSVFMTGHADIYAASDLPDGTIRVYHQRMGIWYPEALPAGVHGPAGQIVGGQPVYFRTGGAILRHVDHQWKVALACNNLGASGGLVFLSRDQILAPCVGGVHIFDGHRWSWNAEKTPVHVNGAWGGRDAKGELHMFAGGGNDSQSQLEIFQFVENSQGQLSGDFQCVVEHPDGGALVGVANRAWGSQVHDVYVTGSVDGIAHVFHFDGLQWRDIAPEPIRAAAIDVAGDANGALWVSLSDGRLLHRQATAAPLAGRDPVPNPIVPGDLQPAVGATVAMVVSGEPNGMHAISFSLPEARDVSLAVFDLAGRRVETLERGRLSAGLHRVVWDASRVPSGVYFCRLEAGALTATRKMFVQR